MTSSFSRLQLAVLCGAVVAIVISCALSLPGHLVPFGIGLGIVMLAIAAIDWQRFIIPDILSLPLVPAGLVASGRLVEPGAVDLVAAEHLLGALLGAGCLWLVAVLYRRWRGADGLGLGDVKLMAAGGAWVGSSRLSHVLLLASVSALVFAFVAAARAGVQVDRQARVPFGSFLAPSIWLVSMLAWTGVIA